MEGVVQEYLIRPFQMLFTPICFLLSPYAAFVSGGLYANLGGFSIAFEDKRGWGPVTGNLLFNGSSSAALEPPC